MTGVWLNEQDNRAAKAVPHNNKNIALVVMETQNILKWFKLIQHRGYDNFEPVIPARSAAHLNFFPSIFKME
jgi:hypothetical protein